MMDIDAAIELFCEDDIDVEFKVGGEKVFMLKAKDKNIDVTIFEAGAFKDLIRRAKKCRS